MDWARAIEINRIALTRIVAELVAMLGLVSGSKMVRLLRPAESALRRLIVIAARGLVVKLSPKRVRPKGLKAGGKRSEPMSFRLFDARKRFDFIKPEHPNLVFVQTYTSNPFYPFDKMYLPRLTEISDSLDRSHLGRRLEAMKLALLSLPRQAQRMARWKARRKLMEKPKFTSPLRLGSPPGHRDRPEAEVDFVLQECHGLAWDVLREDTS